jgi:hypothetical protein
MNTLELLQISTIEYVMFLPVNQMAQAKMQKRLKAELKGAKIEPKRYPKEFAVQFGKLYRQDTIAKGIFIPVASHVLDKETRQLLSDRTEFLTRLTDLRLFMEEKNLHKTMPYSHKRILEILKENA